MARPRGLPTISAGFRATPSVVDRMNRVAALMGMSRNEYLLALVHRDMEHLKDDGTPVWWEPPSQPELPLDHNN